MKTIPIRPLLTLKLATLAALAFLLLLLNGCHWDGVRGNGHVVTDPRTIANFTRLEANGAFTIHWISGPAKLTITTDENLLRHIRTNVSGDRLRIDWTKGLRATHGIRIEVATPELSRVTLNGALTFEAVNLAGPEFYLEGNGATKAVLSGNVNAMSGELNGAGKLEANNLATRAMELSISGAGKAEVNVTDALKVEISGAGKVVYAGNPRVSKEISGAGSVSKRD